MVELKEVNKTYILGGEPIYALKDVNLHIGQGDFLALVGPSGSGKSTLANLVGGLDTPTSGEVTVGGQKLSRLSDRELSHYRNKTVGFIFQNFQLQPRQTVLENVMLPLVLAGEAPVKRKERAMDCLAAVGLADRVTHKPTQLSGGQRQRVAIARALANKPCILIADEPTGNLDSAKGAEIINILKKLNQEEKVTVIMVTHDHQIAALADRIITVFDGRIS